MNLDRQAWIDRARAVPIMHEIERRGIKLKRVGAEYIGPCPLCGGTDRFSVNANKKVWNCRGCRIGGDVIDLVQHLDGGTFDQNIATLAGPPTNSKSNGKHHSAEPYRQHRGWRAQWSGDSGRRSLSDGCSFINSTDSFSIIWRYRAGTSPTCPG